MRKSNQLIIMGLIASAGILFGDTQSIHADSNAYPTQGSVSFIVNPDSPDEPAVPINPTPAATPNTPEAGKDDDVTDIHKLPTSHTYTKPTSDVVVVNDDNAHQPSQATLPNTGDEGVLDKLLRVFGISSLTAVTYIMYRRFR